MKLKSGYTETWSFAKNKWKKVSNVSYLSILAQRKYFVLIRIQYLLLLHDSVNSSIFRIVKFCFRSQICECHYCLKMPLNSSFSFTEMSILCYADKISIFLLKTQESAAFLHRFTRKFLGCLSQCGCRQNFARRHNSQLVFPPVHSRDLPEIRQSSRSQLVAVIIRQKMLRSRVVSRSERMLITDLQRNE